MCRYAIRGPYKIHYACFDCHKSFKQPSIEDWLAVRDSGKGYAYRQLKRVPIGKLLVSREGALGVTLDELFAEYQSAAFNCPQCNAPMADLGRDFKAPRASDRKAWKQISRVYTLGHAFHTCGCTGPGFIPNTPREYQEYLERQRAEYARMRDYYSDADCPAPATEAKAARQHWMKRLSAIEQAIACSTLE
jgi:hypothetical protein